MRISLAQTEHIDNLAALFDQYRVFYDQTSDLAAAKRFLNQRFQQRDSVIFVAEDDQIMAGFTQLYPSFSSVSMKRVWILNDLFVVENYRKQGIANLLMDTAEQYARDTNAVRIILATQITNTAAQILYESRNYARDEAFYHYALHLG
ncbi:GNAT family N-acetyltransferase [Oscillatoria sp. FACHB-1407]|uniref:GNAT family N-acetyltransferase n=1 Tax=Oscillatoria sp. FACHB-1407 TaxID=2692847 RepID=UPI001687C5A4|nr:GNAT family N-acetyltransferase [Oscillatoria sp. FACHB-1407]MBD2465843.1 GNAT family N-acetyltransferase [Oscillatoria sp. FACHB-1407]